MYTNIAPNTDYQTAPCIHDPFCFTRFIGRVFDRRMSNRTTACNANSRQWSRPTVTETLEPSAVREGEFLTPKEEEIIAAFDLENAGEWLAASEKYQQLANNAVQPERSAFLLRAGLMYYRAEYYFIIDEYFETMAETIWLEMT